MTFHPKIDYRELHRSKRQMPVDDGKAFVYTPENRERLEAIARRYPENPAGRRSAILPALYLVQRQIGYVSLSAIAARRRGHRLHVGRRRRRRVVLHDVLHAAGRQVRRAGVPHAAVRAAWRRAGHRRADGGARHRAERHRSVGHVHADGSRVPRRVRSRAARDGQRQLARVPRSPKMRGSWSTTCARAAKKR